MSTLFAQQQQLLVDKLRVLAHLQAGLQWSLERLPPLSEDNLAKPEIGERIAAIVDRFCKLQDQFAGTMRHAHAMVGEKNRSFSDVVTWAVEHDILASNVTWLELRSLRNQLTHEYDLESDRLPELIAMVEEGFQTMNASIATFESASRSLGLV